MQKHLRCESVDKYGHRCSKKKTHVDHERRKNAKTDDPSLKLHTAFGKSWS